MIKKEEELSELYSLTEDERAHIELGFLRDFIEVLDKNEFYYKNHNFFKGLGAFVQYAREQLKWKEDIIA